ncbi:GH15 family glucan-1,4-alpha-glucosidase [Pseudorhizobium tarimense]|uniref:GH15 family glucan-1,4-alpha-glucosidase n=1 Tax=Pseudorhizobium tarimense TaxID=1079109 RepID=A0ABV2H6A9_9HYPH|nr:glycoside hydrolase family 15 protein [Pseudorhizobium tarimense]MCJ8519093.1 glycoside hydrolase family 15 protein [Pseudorhizobium tarimense]
MPARIEDYAMIGDCETAALVSKGGSIDWLCLPRFDSPACFSALLGTVENGHWSITPAKPYSSQRSYVEDTLVLETLFTTETGTAAILDFMPPRDGSSNLVRIVEGRHGHVDFDIDLVMRFGYGRNVPWVSHGEAGRLTAVAGPDRLTLQSPVELKGQDFHSKATVTVSSGERLPFTLTHSASHEEAPTARDPEAALQQTVFFWREFVSRCPPVNSYTPIVKRSLITLKAMTYLPTGGIVAAVTTSLPEKIGGLRNWDYRYCWLRDATMTLMAFMNLGYLDEAQAWREWLMRAVAGTPEQMQIMYGVAGERHLPEWEADWLEGYENSRPVRIGNAAAGQFQLDVYGEVADALAQALRLGLPPHPRTRAISRVLLSFLETAWRKPDEGIWEVRSGPAHFTHSKIMAWVAFDRAARLAKDAGGDIDGARRWRSIANEIHADVCRNGYDEEIGSFVQAYGSKVLDASLLQIPLVGFLPPDDPRVVSTVEAIEHRLVQNGLVLRYETDLSDDGLPGGEGAFLVCSFWLCDALVLMGRYADAKRLYEKLTALCNDVGLLSEEYDPVDARMLGNFPQAFSHIGLISTALNLARSEGPAEERSQKDEKEDVG